MPDPKKNLAVLYSEYGKDINDGKLSEEEFISKLSNPVNRKAFFEAYKDDFENASTQEEFDAFLGYSKATDYFVDQFVEKPKKDIRVGVSSPKEIMIANPASAASKVYTESQSKGLKENVLKQKELSEKINAGDPYLKGLTGKTVPLSDEDEQNLRSDIEDIQAVSEDIKKGSAGSDQSLTSTEEKENVAADELRANDYETLESIDSKITSLQTDLDNGFEILDLPVGKTDRLAPQKSELNQEQINAKQQQILDLQQHRSKMLALSGTPITSNYSNSLEKQGKGGAAYETSKATALKNLTRLESDATYLQTKLPDEFKALQAQVDSGQQLSPEDAQLYNDYLTNDSAVAEFKHTAESYHKQRNQILFQYPEEAQKAFSLRVAEIAANSDTPAQVIAKTLSSGANDYLKSVGDLLTGLGRNREGKTVEEHRKAFEEGIAKEASYAKGTGLTGPIIENVVERNGIRIVVDPKNGEIQYIRDADSDRKLNEKRLTAEQKAFLDEYKANPKNFKSFKDFSHKRALDAALYSTVLMAPVIGTSMLSGGASTPTSLAVFSTMFGQSYEQGKQLFADDPDANVKAYLYAIPLTAIQSAVELGFGGVEKGVGEAFKTAGSKAAYNWASKEALRATGDSFFKVLGKQLSNVGKSVGNRIGKEGVGETVEELVQQVVGDAGAAAAGENQFDLDTYLSLPLATFYGTSPMLALQGKFENDAYKNGLVAASRIPNVAIQQIEQSVADGKITQEEGIRKIEILQNYSKSRQEYQDAGLNKKELSEVEQLVAERMLLEEKVQGVSENFLSKRIKGKIAQINEQIKGIIEEGDTKEDISVDTEEEVTPMGAESDKGANETTPDVEEIKTSAESVSQNTPEGATEGVTEGVKMSPEIQKLEEERDVKIAQISKPNLELTFIAEDSPNLNKQTGSMVKVKSGSRMTERPHTFKDAQKAIQREHSLLQKLIDCL